MVSKLHSSQRLDRSIVLEVGSGSQVSSASDHAPDSPFGGEQADARRDGPRAGIPRTRQRARILL